MGRFLDTSGKRTNDEKLAATDPKTKAPVANPARNIWVTSTALTTALNTAYFAESVATFVMAIGFALLLVGLGFLILTLGPCAAWSHTADRRGRLPVRDARAETLPA